MLERAVDAKIPLKAVHASRRKAIRAEPISALYWQGKVHHFGTFPPLEAQMCEQVPGIEKSPDRIDALFWAITKLTEKSLQHGNIDLTKWIRTMPRYSIDP